MKGQLRIRKKIKRRKRKTYPPIKFNRRKYKLYSAYSIYNQDKKYN